jgi:hypothetical protein
MPQTASSVRLGRNRKWWWWPPVERHVKLLFYLLSEISLMAGPSEDRCGVASAFQLNLGRDNW